MATNLGMLGNLLKGGLRKGTQIKHKLPKDIARRKVDQNLAKKLKAFKNVDQKAGKALSKTPLAGGFFEKAKDVPTGANTFKRVQDFSVGEPVSKAKKLAVPMLAYKGLSSTIEDKREAEKQKVLQEFQEKGGNTKVANVSQLLEKTAADLTKSASVIKKLKEERDEQLEKIASIKEHQEQREKAFEHLVKMAKMEQISIEDFSEELEKLASMDKEEFEVEMRALEKVASNSFINYGNVGSKSSGSEDPLVDFIMKNSTY